MKKNLYPSLVRLLFEQDDAKPAGDAKVQWDNDYQAFVSALGSNASDPKTQAFLKAGKLDGDPKDDTFKFANVAIPVQKLSPTQNEIDVDGSLAYPMKNLSIFKSYVLATSALTIKAPVVTYNGKYVIDGHHRWSQLYACNPDAQINCLDIQIAGMDPLDVLKAVQAAIAVQKGSVPMASVKGSNLLDIDEAGLDAWLGKNVGMKFWGLVSADKDMMSTIKSKLGSAVKEADEPEIDEAAFREAQEICPKYLWSNITQMKSTSQPVSGAPPRDFMPQTDDVDWQAPLAAGEIDIKTPHADPSKVKIENKNRDSAIMERWARLAGILKD